MNHYSTIKKVFIAVLALNVLALGVYGILFLRIKIKNEHTASVLEGAQSDLNKEEFLRVAKFSLDENSESIEKINTFFVSRDGVPDFLETIEGLGRSAGVSLTIGSVSVEPDTKNKDDFKEILKLRVEAVGEWERIMTFLSMIESLPYKESVDRVSLSLEGKRDEILFGAESERVEGIWKGYFEFNLLKLR